MASPYTVKRATHQTLSTTSVDTVNLSEGGKVLNVANRAGSTALTFTFASAGGTAAAPTSLVDDAYVVPSGLALTLAVTGGAGVLQVKVLGNGNDYSVQVLA